LRHSLSSHRIFRRGWQLEAQFGLYLVGSVISTVDLIYLAVILGLGIAIGLIPVWKASRLALKDVLSVKVWVEHKFGCG
jgi:hypothetical protein